MNDDEKNTLSHEALLRELLHIDNLVEKHSQLVIVISGAVFGFAATRLDNHAVVYLAAAFGIATALEWILKIRRHYKIFKGAHGKLEDVEVQLGLNVKAARSLEKGTFSLNGFTILLWFAGLLILFWLFLGFGVGLGLFAETHSSASQVVEAVTKELPTVTGISPVKWTFTSMSWDDASQSYALIVDSDNPATTWLVTYDTRNRRIAKSTLKGPNQPPSTFFGISDVQRRLLDLGYHPGPVDGIMGRNTIDAVRRFQIDHSLQATGGLDKETIEKLGFPQVVTK